MPARRVKTLLRNPREQNHREHRSKRGREPFHTYRRFTRLLKNWKMGRDDRKEKPPYD